MPRANIGTLLENIILVEVTKSLDQNSPNGGMIDFINSFAMPPLSEWRAKETDYGLDSTSLNRISEQSGLGVDYISLMAACMRHDSSRGPNGALLFNLILRLSNRVGRFWLNDAPDEEMRYKNEPFELSALNAATAAVLKMTLGTCEVATCRQLFPESLNELEKQLQSWKESPSVARLGYLDPDSYSSNGMAENSPQTDSESVQRFLRNLSDGFEGPSASIHFTAHRMKGELDRQVSGLKRDGHATGFDVCVCRHGGFAVVIHYRNFRPDFVKGIRAAWNSWNSNVLNRPKSYQLEISVPARRSQRWMQFFANEQPAILNHAIRRATGLAPETEIQWRSPLADEEYAEYFDQAFLDRLGIKPPKIPLNEFWPSGGPHWDGLALTSNGEVILVEAKANIAEFASAPCGATDPASINQIMDALSKVQQFMRIARNRARPELWFNAFYQYANRLAHLYYLRELNGIPTHLIFLDFINDPDSGEGAVNSAHEWKSLVQLAEACLGVSANKPLMKYVHHIHFDVGDFA